MSEPHPPVGAIFDAAMELPPEQRAAYLDLACAGDKVLRQRVEALLRAHELGGTFMNGRAGPPQYETFRLEPALSEKPGDQIGHYKLLQQIGEGGCGVVYMAEQEQPVKRRVALKVIKLGMDTKSVIGRFSAERQALALMDHPNIAKVLDAGATETGRPYFVMELVRGIKITDYCDQNNLSTKARLDLFMQVCRAVQHAHQKGIIHRDIKPSNILVTMNDGVPMPKVIDFGIAKATQGKLTDDTVFTAFEQFIGTPAYMSPEQAEMSALDIDTRSDIYSLGVLLYELLTGKTPFDAKELLKAGFDEMRRQIREQEPSRPSTRLSTMMAADLTTIAAHRQAQPPKLINLVSGDLDWIVMKALEKDRARRYETANGFAADIQRHLDDEPVSAGPPGNFYRFQKLVQRNKIMVVAAMVILAVLVIGSGVSTYMFFNEQKAFQLAQVDRENALTESQRAESLTWEIQHHLYAAKINLAQQMFEQGDVARALDLLNSVRPQTGQDDLRGFEWYYLWQLCHSERLSLNSHNGRVRRVAFAPDHLKIATAGDDLAIHLWDATDGHECARLTGHTGKITGLAFAPNGALLASASADKTVRLWSPNTGKEVCKFEGFSNDVMDVAFSPDGKYLAACTGEIEADQGTPFTHYAQKGQGGRIIIWDVITFKQAASFQSDTNGLLSLAFAPDGTLAAGSAGKSVEIWDWKKEKRVATLKDFAGPVFDLAFTPDGKRLVTVDWYPYMNLGTLAFWDVASWKRIPSLQTSVPSVTCLAIAPDGLTVATGGKDQIVRLWDAQTGRVRGSLKGHVNIVCSLAFSGDGRSLVSGSWDGTAKLWDISRNQTYEAFTKANGFSIAFAADGKTLVGAGSNLDFLDTSRSRLLFSLPLSGLQDYYVALTPDGKTLAVGGGEGEIFIYDVASHQIRHTLQGSKNQIWCLAFSPNGRDLATGSADKTITIWDMATWQKRLTLLGHTTSVTRLVFTSDGQTLVTGGWKEMKLWDASTGQLKKTFEEEASRVAVSPDGKILADGDYPAGIKLRDYPTDNLLGVIKGHQADIYSMAFSPDSKTLATASWDGTTKLWSVPGAELLLTIPSDFGVDWSVAFSSDGERLAIGTGSYFSSEVQLLHAATKAEADANAP